MGVKGKPAGFSLDHHAGLAETLCAHFMIEMTAVVASEGRLAVRIEMSVFEGNLSFEVHYLGGQVEAIDARLRGVAERYNVALKAAHGFFSLS